MNKDPLAGGDSLYDEKLLDEDRVQIGDYNEDYDDEDSSNYDDETNYDRSSKQQVKAAGSKEIARSIPLLP